MRTRFPAEVGDGSVSVGAGAEVVVGSAEEAAEVGETGIGRLDFPAGQGLLWAILPLVA